MFQLYTFILFLFQINLRLILVSGKTEEFLFSATESAGEIAQHVFDNWPEGNQNHFIQINILVLTLSATDCSSCYFENIDWFALPFWFRIISMAISIGLQMLLNLKDKVNLFT